MTFSLYNDVFKSFNLWNFTSTILRSDAIFVLTATNLAGQKAMSRTYSFYVTLLTALIKAQVRDKYNIYHVLVPLLSRFSTSEFFARSDFSLLSKLN